MDISEERREGILMLGTPNLGEATGISGKPKMTLRQATGLWNRSAEVAHQSRRGEYRRYHSMLSSLTRSRAAVDLRVRKFVAELQ